MVAIKNIVLAATALFAAASAAPHWPSGSDETTGTVTGGGSGSGGNGGSGGSTGGNGGSTGGNGGSTGGNGGNTGGNGGNTGGNGGNTGGNGGNTGGNGGNTGGNGGNTGGNGGNTGGNGGNTGGNGGNTGGNGGNTGNGGGLISVTIGDASAQCASNNQALACCSSSRGLIGQLLDDLLGSCTVLDIDLLDINVSLDDACPTNKQAVCCDISVDAGDLLNVCISL